MSIQQVNSSSPAYSAPAAQAKPAGQDEAAKNQPPQEEQAYVVEKSQDYKMDVYSVNKLKTSFRTNLDAFEKMVSVLFGAQADSFMRDLLGDNYSVSLKDRFVGLEVDAETQKWAQDAIGEEGFWGVEQTSARILDMAKALSGGDPSKIGLLKDAFLKGFEQAEEMWGGELPEICQKTYEKVLAGFDEWENGGKEDAAASAE